MSLKALKFLRKIMSFKSLFYNILLSFCFIISFLWGRSTQNDFYDLCVVGDISPCDGLGRISIGMIDLLKNDLTINVIPTNSKFKLNELNPEVQSIIINRKEHFPCYVSILTNSICYVNARFYKFMPQSKIKIAYSMRETTLIPADWVKNINEHFDAVVVPDPFLVQVYKNSGVVKPIFELPLGINIDKFLQRPPHQRSGNSFIFGSTVTCDERKNNLLLIQAFAEEFKNSNNVFLKLNSKFSHGDMINRCYDLIRNLGLKNIIFTHNVMNDKQYLEFMDSMDCFVNVSKGEGYSICPREAMALGLPCILSNNTAQKTLCESGFVRGIPSEIPEDAMPFYRRFFGTQHVGVFFNCNINDVREALRDVYNNYDSYLEKAIRGREWVTRFQWENLKLRYLNLIKPKKIILGSENVVTDEYLMTNSEVLYQKYLEILQ